MAKILISAGEASGDIHAAAVTAACLLYTSPSPRDS